MIDLRKGGLPNTVEVDGNPFSIYTDFRVWLKFGELIKNKDCKMKDLYFIFKNQIPKKDFLKQLLEFYTNANATPRRIKETNDDEIILDYIVDGEYIYGSFMSEYEIDLIDIEYLHWHKFKALFLCLPDESKIKKIISFRSYEKSNEKPDEQYRKLKSTWSLDEYYNEKNNKKALDEFNDL